MSNGRRFSILVVAATLLFCLGSLPSFAGDSFQGKVRAISDGDTIVVRSGGRDIVVQLAGIDAPELGQDFGKEARDFIAKNAKKRKVTVEIVERASRQSVVGRILVDGRDLAHALVEEGLAWTSDDSPELLTKALEKARASKEGLWASVSPTPPWEFRKAA